MGFSKPQFLDIQEDYDKDSTPDIESVEYSKYLNQAEDLKRDNE